MNPPDFVSRQVSQGDYFFLDLDPDPDVDLVVVGGGREFCRSDYRISRESFPYWSVEYVVAGEGRLTLDGREFPLYPGTVFRYGPGIAHQIAVSSGGQMDKFFVDFVGKSASSWWIGPWSSMTPLHVPESSRLRSRFEDMLEVGKRLSPQTPRLACLLVEELVLRAVQDAVDLEVYESEAWRTYQRCLMILESQYLLLHSLSDLARACHVGEAWICRLFRDFGSASPYRILTQKKMNYAASRLTDRTLTVKAIAGELGYDPYHFSRVFKSVFGYSPDRFRTVLGPRIAP